MNRSASYVHALNGRLRIKLSELKGNPMRAQEIETHFTLMTGMQQVSANPVTGSVLFIYEPQLLKQEEICAVLRELGYFQDHRGRSNFHPGADRRQSRGGGKNYHLAGLGSHGDGADPPGGRPHLKKQQTPHSRHTRPHDPGQPISLFPQSAGLISGPASSLCLRPWENIPMRCQDQPTRRLNGLQDSGAGGDSGASSIHRRFNITNVLKPNHR